MLPSLAARDLCDSVSVVLLSLFRELFFARVKLTSDSNFCFFLVPLLLNLSSPSLTIFRDLYQSGDKFVLFFISPIFSSALASYFDNFPREAREVTTINGMRERD